LLRGEQTQTAANHVTETILPNTDRKERSTAGSLFAETAAAAAAAAAAAKFAILGTQINATPGSKTETTSVCEKKRKGTFKYQQCDLS